jgi:hypothetical protein
VKDILDELEAIARHHYDRLQVFDDWLNIMLYTCMKRTDDCISILRRYAEAQGSAQVTAHFTKAFELYLSRLEQTREELLSEVYRAWMPAAGNICRLYAPMHIAPLLISLIHLRGGSIYDPACGAGRVFSECLRLMNREQKQSCTFYGHEQELRFAKMCALNLALSNATGYVVWGESEQEIRHVYSIKRGEKGALVKVLTDGELEAFKTRYRVIMNNVEVFRRSSRQGRVNYKYN